MIATAIIFVILGILIKHGKFYNLIAGYNTMSKEEQATYNIEKIATLFRNVMFAMALLIILGYILSKQLENEQISFYAIIMVSIIGIPYLLIKSNSKAYKNNNSN
ncbi:DUF3784 domain-containing protein [Hanstruepera marina]|uniref:DUF3784 domain-containing protein n=1 Tax=Hanstruepera marina TaxID=2873265 RepID=UPI001CA6C2C9|nr:DUF3784 domain-containing protein [Hanstruepera marina]